MFSMGVEKCFSDLPLEEAIVRLVSILKAVP